MPVVQRCPFFGLSASSWETWPQTERTVNGKQDGARGWPGGAHWHVGKGISMLSVSSPATGWTSWDVESFD